MVSSIAGSNFSTQQVTSQTESTDGLTDEQKKKIKEIIAQYEAKEITQAEEQSEIAKVKAEAAKSAKKTTSSNSASGQAKKLIETDVKDPASAMKEDLQKKLSNLLSNKESGNITQSDVDKFVENLRSSLTSDQGEIVDQTA